MSCAAAEGCVFAESIAGALDLDDPGVVEQTIEQGGGDDLVAEDVALFAEAAVGGEDHGAAFVAGVDELEEQVGAAGSDLCLPNTTSGNTGDEVRRELAAR